MKKISLILSIVFAFSIMQMFSVSAYAAKAKEIKYNITFESLFKSEDAKEFNKYKKAFLDFLNKQTERAIRSYRDDTFDYLTLDDIDFTDSKKTQGIKHHYASYTDRAPYPKFKDVMSCLEKDGYNWAVVIQKDDTRYTFFIYKTDAPRDDDTEIGGGWYANACSVLKSGINDYPVWYNSPSIISANLKRTLKECGEEETNIKFVYAHIGDKWDTSYGIVFVNGTAKYIYSYGMDFPCQSSEFREDTPQVVINVFEEISSDLYNNNEAHTWKIDGLYSYSLIMYLYELCEYYEK